MRQHFSSFQDFYQQYLREHTKVGTRVLHFVGTTVNLLTIVYVLWSGKMRFLWYIPIVGYGLPWLSHLIFEKNSLMNLRYFFYDLMADFKMWLDLLLRIENLNLKKRPV